jgi:hypothetical protein
MTLTLAICESSWREIHADGRSSVSMIKREWKSVYLAAHRSTRQRKPRPRNQELLLLKIMNAESWAVSWSASASNPPPLL